MSDAPASSLSSELPRNVAAIIDDLAAAQLDAGGILTSVTGALSKVRSGTWVAALMTKDPNTSLIVSTDSQNPSLADYVDRIVAAIDRPGHAPTMSLSQQVIESGCRLFLPDLPYDKFLSRLAPFEQAYLNDHPLPVAPESLSVLIVPMHSRGAIVGTLALFEGDRTNPINEQDALWFQMVADRVGIATENAQAYEDAIVRFDRLNSLQSVSRAISASFDLTFTLKVILEQITGQLKVDAADVLLIDERDGMLTPTVSSGLKGSAIADIRLPTEEGWSARRLRDRHIETVTSPDELSQRRRRSLFAREGFKTYGTVPLAPRGTFTGMIEVFHRSALSPDQEWLSFLDAMASVAATAVEISALNERVRIAGSSNPSAKSRIRAPDLTKVEWEILKLLVEGQTNREISVQVHLSQNTVKFHVRQLLQKTGTANRTDLTRQAIQQGWLQ